MTDKQGILSVATKAAALSPLMWRTEQLSSHLETLATLLRDAAEILSALEYELQQLATGCDVESQDREKTEECRERLEAVSNDAVEHVKKAIDRLPVVERAYEDRVRKWLMTSLDEDSAATLSSYLESAITLGPQGAAELAQWAADTAKAALRAEGDPRLLTSLGQQAKELRVPLMQGLRAVAQVTQRLFSKQLVDIPPGSIRVPVPEVRQETGASCGASALQAVCRYYGVGPEEEWDFRRDMYLDERLGSHGFQIIRAATLYGLSTSEIRNGTLPQIRQLLDESKPILLMIQAWGDPEKASTRKDYVRTWNEGHWVVAIGYDEEGFFFEDPSLAGVRGYLSEESLARRWRDVGPHNRYLPGYGIAIWDPRSKPAGYFHQARVIE